MPFLTAEETRLLPSVAQRWLMRAFRTGAADRAAAEDAAAKLLAARGKGPLRYVVWVDSPLEGVLAATIMHKSLSRRPGFEPNDGWLGYEAYLTWRRIGARMKRARGIGSDGVLAADAEIDTACQPVLGSGAQWDELRAAHGFAATHGLAQGGDAALWERVGERVADGVLQTDGICRRLFGGYRDQAMMCFFGQYEPHMLSLVELHARGGVDLEEVAHLPPLAAACCMAWVMKGGAVLCEPPLSVQRVEGADGVQRFTSVVYKDGWEVRPGQFDHAA